jgi:phosphatidylglycerophosphate synthase
MNYKEFQKCTFPEKSTFERKQFDFVTNLVKWLAMRVSFVFYKMGVTANMLDIFTLITSLFGAILVLTMIDEYNIIPVIIGLVLLAFGVFVDFVDGPIAKARGECSRIGDALDNLGVDLVRSSLIIIFGILSSESYMIIVNIFSIGVLFTLVPIVSKEIKENELWSDNRFLVMILNLYTHKYSFLGVRTMVPLLLFTLFTFAITGADFQLFSYMVSVFYAALSMVWLMLIIKS